MREPVARWTALSLTEDAGHDVFERQVPREDLVSAARFDEPPGLAAAPVDDLDAQGPPAWPGREPTETLLRRVAILLASGGTAHFDLSPDECGGWEWLFA